jgi:hypothetical protein
MSEDRPTGGGSGNGGAPPADDLRSLIAASVADDKKAGGASPGIGHNQPPEPIEDGEGDAPPPSDRKPAAASAPSGGDAGAAAEPAAKAAPGEDDVQRAAAAAPAPARPAVAGDAPAHWSDADKAQFNALPAPARAPFLELYKRMESGFTPKLQRGAQLERDYGELDRSVFTPEQRQILNAHGFSPTWMVNAWADIERGLCGQSSAVKNEIVGRMIHHYGVDAAGVADVVHQLRGFAPAGGGDRGAVAANGGAMPGAVPTAVDPALYQRLQALENRDIAERYRAAGDQIQTFANEMRDGQLRHPFFAELEAEMTSLAQFDRTQGRAPVLEDLYDRALWATPSTREKQQAAQRDAEAKQAAEERKAKSEQARRAGSSITGAPGPGQSAQAANDLSLRDTIKANMGGARNTSGGPGRI